MVPESDDPSPVREDTLDASCPLCGGPGLQMRSMALDIPYFGDALQTTVLCGSCGFRHADVLLTKQGAPTRHTLHVRDAGDLSARVVRSSSCTVRVPEIGAVMEPGPRSDAFISNAEGVLHRFREIFEFLGRNGSTKPRRDGARGSLDRLAGMIEGREPFTLVLEDPFGNSGILHDAGRVEGLSDDEVRGLKTGVFTLELRPGGPRARASP
jgi:zinc finger protein